MDIAGHHSLDPVPKPIALFPRFISNQTQALILKEKVLSISGDSFDIKLDNGQLLLKVAGAWVSLSDRKKVEDANGNHLFDITKEHLHIHTTYAIKDPNQNKIAEVKNSHSLIGSKATATFNDSNGNAVTLFMKGSMMDHSAEIIDESNNQPVARIDRKLLSGRDFLFGQQSYAVIVAPGVDAALIAALCICFDEKNNEK
ncbi:hypothetical protein N7462_005087 [Penicillium macrosclerotiorum]|uniref:uncharacterized protein n=1 Tax=Penicillium macrosclerotiorum TaxID=303699 RepID=UPI002547163C|nr:uncharacterized protein N7462_005087 [Penicillium macrosclerotiorum]KAJ5690695.1 hypothetical protein N7462_005087 [Penicillium macrosclerotiorum]